jgi:hypothetical protein
MEILGFFGLDIWVFWVYWVGSWDGFSNPTHDPNPLFFVGTNVWLSSMIILQDLQYAARIQTGFVAI